MAAEFKEVDGDLWPAGDRKCHRHVGPALPHLLHYISLCRQKRIAVQAGGNCGIWPREMARHFEWVYTFEPDASNFHCLVRNAPARNILKFQAALGAEAKTVAMFTSEENVGAHSICENKGVIPVIRVDDLALPCCDLLQLDIEGYEYFALLGAENTIRRYKPVIVLEHKWRCGNYGLTKEKIEAWLRECGYTAREKLANDVVFLPEA